MLKLMSICVMFAVLKMSLFETRSNMQNITSTLFVLLAFLLASKQTYFINAILGKTALKIE